MFGNSMFSFNFIKVILKFERRPLLLSKDRISENPFLERVYGIMRR